MIMNYFVVALYNIEESEFAVHCLRVGGGHFASLLAFFLLESISKIVVGSCAHCKCKFTFYNTHIRCLIISMDMLLGRSGEEEIQTVLLAKRSARIRARDTYSS